MNVKSRLTQFAGELPGNIFSGFVVSLVALPLGLGLAMASGAPPMAGIIAAVVGGILVSILGGSYVSITGPGNGLVVVVLAAITTLGNGNMYQGYLYTLAAIICSGALILLLAFANLGKLSDFFPSSAIQGLLAAIGIIILSKQFHIMVGHMDAEGSVIELLFSIPRAIKDGFQNAYRMPAAIAGLASLAIMVFYARIRNKYFQLIPAPMWIVLISVLLAYFFEYKIGVAHPIPKAFFLQIPTDVFTSFPRPDFSAVFTGNFIMAVIPITLIASIESLLSIKAVDKLDPQRRISNTKKDLKALGIATIVSGFLGGLNVVTVIARSSVNVNNNGTNRSANFFQAIFLVVFILVFKNQLQHIPFPALAAILVYTGYKLSAPSIISRVTKIGKEQLLIFMTTLLVTLFSGIVTGILVGIGVTFLIHIYFTRGIKFFINNFSSNNIESRKGDDGTIYVTVKEYCSFLNFYKLKKVLESITLDNTVIVDFLQCKLIDHTVMENMKDYEQRFDKNGGRFELIGLDLHRAESQHPFALRRVLEFVHIVPEETGPGTRELQVSGFCNDIGWQFSPSRDYHLFFLNGFNYFKTRQVDHLFNIAHNPEKNIRFFDIAYSEGAFIAEEELHASMLYIQCKNTAPAFTLSRGDLYERLHYLAGFREIKLKKFKDFAQRFSLRGINVRKIRRFFTEEMILFLESNNYYHIESDGKGGILIMDKEKQSDLGEVKAMIDYAIRLEIIINNKTV